MVSPSRLATLSTVSSGKLRSGCVGMVFVTITCSGGHRLVGFFMITSSTDWRRESGPGAQGLYPPSSVGVTSIIELNVYREYMKSHACPNASIKTQLEVKEISQQSV